MYVSVHMSFLLYIVLLQLLYVRTMHTSQLMHHSILDAMFSWIHVPLYLCTSSSLCCLDTQSSLVIARGADLSKMAQAICMKPGLVETSSAGNGERGELRVVGREFDTEGGAHIPVSPACVDVRDLVLSVEECGSDVEDQADEGIDAGGKDSSCARDACWIYYTSGSTGEPKGVVCEHGCAVGYLTNHPMFDPMLPVNAPRNHATQSDTQTDRDTEKASENAHDSKRHCRSVVGEEVGEEQARVLRVLVPSSFTFDPSGLRPLPSLHLNLRDVAPRRLAAHVLLLVALLTNGDTSAGDIFATLAHGGVVCLAPRGAMLSDLGACLSFFAITHVCSTPAVWRTVTKDPGELAHLRVVALGGEPMSDALISRWAKRVTLLNLYGTTEATVYQLVSVWGWVVGRG